MFYGRDSIENQFAPLLKKLEDHELFLFIPIPDYKMGERWTDEFRIRDGYTKLADGSWVTVHKMTTYIETLQKSTSELYDNYRETIDKLNLAKQQNTEMEFGLRTAQKSLNKALEMKGDNDE